MCEHVFRHAFRLEPDIAERIIYILMASMVGAYDDIAYIDMGYTVMANRYGLHGYSL